MPLSTPERRMGAIVGVAAALFSMGGTGLPMVYYYGKLNERVEGNFQIIQDLHSLINTLETKFDAHFGRVEDHFNSTDRDVNTNTVRLNNIQESRAAALARLSKAEEGISELRLTIMDEIKKNTNELLDRWQSDEKTRSDRAEVTQSKLDDVAERLAVVAAQQNDGNRRLELVAARLDAVLTRGFVQDGGSEPMVRHGQ